MSEIEKLQAVLIERDKEIQLLKSKLNEYNLGYVKSCHEISAVGSVLNNEEIQRYSRQLILPEIGVEGQIRLKNSKVLIVGAGGLGCPVGMYLAGAGVGTIGVVDYDVLDLSNLHRQVSHTESFIGNDKCASFAHSMRNINSSITILTHSLLLNSTNAEEIIKSYDIIVDASDNVPTRYLLNDAAVLFKKPLVSGSALKFEGQLIVYNYKEGPCYRCLFPNPPSPDVTTNCSDGGVLGAITGCIGSLQALEVIKIIVGLDASYYRKMLVFDGLTGYIRIFKIRGKKTDCDICGDNPSITKLIDYEIFCNTKANDKGSKLSLLMDSERVSCAEYKSIIDSGVAHVLVDVRSENEIKICHLPNFINVPINKIRDENYLVPLQSLIDKTNEENHYVVCRRGNDSQKAVQILQEKFRNYRFQDIIGGLYAWHDEIDDTIPLY